MKTEFIFKNKKIQSVGFFGFGRSNRALFEYLQAHYSGLTYVLRSDAPVLQELFSDARFGRNATGGIFEDVLFLSPSVRRDRPELQAASIRGTILSSDVEFFFEHKKIPTIAVTGSDGKSTTVTMASLMLTDSLGSFPASANIGVPMASLLDREGIVGTVAELSSFQLMDFMPSARRALITNVSENHLDWHKSFSEYVAAKENVLARAEERVFNLDSKICLALAKKYPVYAAYSTKLTHREMKSLVYAENYFHIDCNKVYLSGEQFFDMTALPSLEAHNLKNFLSAIALCHGLVSKRSITRAAEAFRPLAHRRELVFTHGGISFYDSSIDSTPTRTRTTLSSFSAPTVLILGGRSKSVSYSGLFPLPKAVKAIVLTGENKGEIQKALFTNPAFISGKIPVYYAEPFSEAVIKAASLAKAGDAVLLSPASTSFDCFNDYAERGNAFSDIIKKYYSAD